MRSCSSNTEILCKLPLREIQENLCTKTHPKIDIAEEISNSPRACRKSSAEHLCQNQFSNRSSKFLQNFSQRYCFNWLDLFRRFFDNLRKKFLPQKLSSAWQIAEYVETRNWSNGNICCMSWHPHLFKLAIASTDDVVRIYTEEGITRPLLKYKFQKSITCLAWRPCDMEDLALGCIKGIILWFADTPKTKLIHPKLLIHGDHAPVTSVAWKADGQILASCSPNDSSVLFWNVENGYNTPFKRFDYNYTLLRWASATKQLFCATVNTTFRIWQLDEFFTCEHWRLNSGRVKSACWSPCGKILLFITSSQAEISCLKLVNSTFENGSNYWKAFRIADLSALQFNGHWIGGMPQSIVWDECGIFVGITFRESNCVALFLTKIEGNILSIVPYGFVAGAGEEYPQCICFQSYNLFSQNVVLTIGWSSGRIEFCLLSGA